MSIFTLLTTPKSFLLYLVSDHDSLGDSQSSSQLVFVLHCRHLDLGTPCRNLTDRNPEDVRRECVRGTRCCVATVYPMVHKSTFQSSRSSLAGEHVVGNPSVSAVAQNLCDVKFFRLSTCLGLLLEELADTLGP